MAVLADLSESEKYLFAILQDQSGIDAAEFSWTDETSPDFVFRCYDYQYPWYRNRAKFQIDQAARAIGKSVGIQMRAWAFCFTNPGEEMLLTAPELIHLDPVTKNVEDRIMSTRLSREFLKKSGTSNGITHRPFEASFRNGARIIGRIPQKDGKGVKGQHPKKLEMDEAQDYPEPGWVELGETLKFGEKDATWRSHGVSRGVRDRYYKQTQPESGWYVHKISAMHRPDWSEEERAAKAELYGSREHPDYRRNILGMHGDASSALFVLTRLMACFVAGTEVWTPFGTVPIETLTTGDSVLNANGAGRVTAAKESLRDRLVKITFSSGEQVICTPEHPFFTDRGWCHADRLAPGFGLVGVGEAVRLVRGSDHLEPSRQVLREALRRELARVDQAAGAAGHADDEALRVVRDALLSAGQDDPVLRELVRRSVAGCTAPTGGGEGLRDLRCDVHAAAEDRSVLLLKLSGELGEYEQASEGGDEATRFAPAGTRARRTAGAAVHALAGAARRRPELAAAALDEPAGHGPGGQLPAARPGTRRHEDGSRGGRPQPPVLPGARLAGDGVAVVDRVASVEVLEPGSPDFDSRAREDDLGRRRVPVYDLSVSGHPSFAVGEHAVLVHNCVDQNKDSAYNQSEYYSIRINDEKLRDTAMPIEALLDFPASHRQYERVWVGMDVGMTNHPSEILIFAEEHTSLKGGKMEGTPNMRLKTLARVHLERISSPDQRAVLHAIWEFYRPLAIAMDRTGLGLPIFQEIVESKIPGFSKAMRGYNFSEKIPIGYEEVEDSEYDPDNPAGKPIMANVLEYSSDMLRVFVDQKQLLLPWDIDMLREFQGQTYVVTKSNTDAYGKKKFNQGKFHALDAVRMAVLGHLQERIDAMRVVIDEEPVFDSFVMF